MTELKEKTTQELVEYLGTVLKDAEGVSKKIHDKVSMLFADSMGEWSEEERAVKKAFLTKSLGRFYLKDLSNREQLDSVVRDITNEIRDRINESFV